MGQTRRVVGLDRAREAVERESWAAAYEELRALDASALAPRDLEGLADAAWWLGRVEESLAVRRDAYAGHAAAGDDGRAALTAVRLFIDHFFRAEWPEATAWLTRGRRHVEASPGSVEEGYVALGWAYMAHAQGDLLRARSLAGEARAAGERHGERDLAAMGADVLGRVLISDGSVGEGMALLDELMVSVVAGELGSLVTGAIYCNVLSVCLELADLGRAGAWSRAALDWCRSRPSEAPFHGFCRLDRAQVHLLQGAWEDAEVEALRAEGEVAFSPFAVGWASVTTGEIRRRTGDLAGAEEAFLRARELGVEPEPGLALLRLAQGKTDAAMSGLRVALAAESLSRLRRSRLLGGMVEVALAAGRIEEARSAGQELRAIAGDFGTPALDASAGAAEGALLLAEGDVAGALRELRRAWNTWQELGLPYEAAQARTLFGLAVRRAGDEEDARLELEAARASFERLGATVDVRRVAGLLGGRPELPAGLTEREVEVLRLVARGKTNREIASALFISEHTVARHLQNVFAKLDVSSRAAATAFAFEHDLL